MTFFKKWTQEKCPICHETLTTDKSNMLFSHVIKTCPEDHYEREFIPSLEGYVEHYNIAVAVNKYVQIEKTYVK